MDLSIIIPAYNVETYIEECLESALGLNIDDFEILIIDDGSTDSTPVIIENYSLCHSKIKFIKQDHRGASAARNVGISSAEGDYIFFLDSDDFIVNPPNLKMILDICREKDVDICFFNALINGEYLYQQPFPSVNVPISGTEMMRRLYNVCRTIPTPVWMQLYRRHFLVDNYLHQKEGSIHEDELFTPIALYNASCVLCINEPIVHYRLNRTGAVTTQHGEKYYNDWVNIGRDLYKYFKNEVQAKEDEPYRQTFGVYFQLINILLSKGISPSKYISSFDRKIMKYCAKTRYEKRYFYLTCFSYKLLYKYLSDSISPLWRKLINNIS